MERRRFLLSSAALGGALGLSACQVHTPATLVRPAAFPTRMAAEERLRAKMRAAGFRYGAPVHLIAYKKERHMEAWVETSNGRYKKFTTYEICNYSGRPGPKQREGDNQTPEGFYELTPNLLNPWSNYHLSIDIGFPNHYDRAKGYTGSHLAMHGGCLSIGCYAMGNWAIEEIFLMVEQAFLQGAPRVTFAGYPFRSTKANWDRWRGGEWMGFWRNLFASNTLFETTGRPPYYSVIAGRYTFTPYPQGTNTSNGYPER